MAKKSIEARQRKREALVAKFAEKRAALKAAGDYAAFGSFTKECFTGAFKEPLPVNRPPKRVYETLWFIQEPCFVIWLCRVKSRVLQKQAGKYSY